MSEPVPVAVSKWGLLRLALRCLFVQSSWNYRQFQGLGWCVALLPELREFYPSDKLAAVLSKYLRYFNTNTFFVSSVAGATIAIEAKHSQGCDVPIEAHQYADAVMAPVAAVGDALFWGGYRSLICCFAVALAAYGFWWAPILLVVLFNLPVVVVRICGVWIGYNHGAAVIGMVQRAHLADVALVLKRATVVLLGAVCAVLVHGAHLPLGWAMATNALVVAIVLAAVFCLRKGVPTAIVLCTVIVSVTTLSKLLM
ncbi:MAG: PTS system mannose/fructose/sorbose family transporter subunit IID [Desulfuromonas sp.]|nr:PTS system mannose/fructose/sorbose family transporter subunit IID [Desulfuromonas sp.]